MYWKYLFCAVLTAVFLVCMGALVFMQYIDIRFVSEAACTHSEYLNLDSKFTYCFYGDDWDEETYLSAISGFYTALITLLIAAQAIVSTLAFFVIKTSNKSLIEAEVSEGLGNFFRLKDADNVLREALKGNLEELVQSQVKQEVNLANEAFYKLQNRVDDEIAPLLAGLQGEVEELKVKFNELVEGENGLDGGIKE